jgi:hypothetical protein
MSFGLFIAILIWSVLFLAIGFYGSFYMFTGLELNDRLKYEAAYLNGYVGVQRQLKKGDHEKAEEIMDLLIDAHVKTLQEFRFLESSSLSHDINFALCRAVDMRKAYPREPKEHSEESTRWYSEIDEFLKSTETKCPYGK